MGGSGILLYDVVNRVTPISELVFGRGVFGGASIPRERGYITVWSGWQGDLKDGPRLNIDVPIATAAGQTITGVIRTEYIVNAPTSTQDLSGGPFTGANHKSYPVTSFDTSRAVLTQRVKESDAREIIPANKFAFANCLAAPFPGVPDPTRICLQDGFNPNFIYELLYEGKDPLVLGLGFAATRDLVSFLHHQAADDYGNLNPIAGEVRHTLAHGTSQSGRYLATFIGLGFNEDEAGRIVFEGVNPCNGPRRAVSFPSSCASSLVRAVHASSGSSSKLNERVLNKPAFGRLPAAVLLCERGLPRGWALADCGSLGGRR